MTEIREGFVVACGLVASFSFLAVLWLPWHEEVVANLFADSVVKEEIREIQASVVSEEIRATQERNLSQLGKILFKGHKVFEFDNVCITDSPPFGIKVGRDKFINLTKKITVFNSSVNADRHSLLVDAPHKSKTWNLTFTEEAMNKSFNLLDNTAIFVIVTCPGNLHHFWADEFLALQSLVASQNLTTPDLPNHIFYQSPNRHKGPECSSVDRYSLILSSLNMESHKWFGAAEHGTCYKRAIFGRAPLVYPEPSAAKFVLDHLHLNWGDCTQKTVTIILRENRKILNVAEIERKLAQHNYSVISVDMAKLSDIDQLRTAMCSSVLIGVQGAGLQWLVFMQKGSAVVEIAWPEKGWIFYYKYITRAHEHTHWAIEPDDISINWDVYEKTIGKVPEEKREKLIRAKPRFVGNSIWKFADVTVDPQKVLEAVSQQRPKQL